MFGRKAKQAHAEISHIVHPRTPHGPGLKHTSVCGETYPCRNPEGVQDTSPVCPECVDVLLADQRALKDALRAYNSHLNELILRRNKMSDIINRFSAEITTLYYQRPKVFQ